MDQFCAKTGEHHRQYPASYAVCPMCGIQLHHSGPLSSPVRTLKEVKQDVQEVIEIIDTPIKPESTAQFITSQVPRTKLDTGYQKASRTEAEIARQDSIQRTGQRKSDTKSYKVTLNAVYVKNVHVKNVGFQYDSHKTLRTYFLILEISLIL